MKNRPELWNRGREINILVFFIKMFSYPFLISILFSSKIISAK